MSLHGVLDEETIRREIIDRADAFEQSLALARTRIPTVLLRDIFPAELERGAIRLENFLGHWGNVSVEELCKLCLIVAWMRPRRILEIGTFNGMTTLQLALNAPDDCVVYTLDLPEGALAEGLNDIDSVVARHARDRFGTSTGSYFAARKDVRIRQLLGDSASFDYPGAIDGPVDVVFIDGAHDAAHKRIDTEAALSLLTPGGVILWHNFADIVNPDVTAFLYELAENYPVVHLKNTLLAIYRSPLG